jgi:copper(I)-binding protein
MLVGLLRALEAGTMVPLTLKFQKAGEIKVSVPVLALTAQR